MLISFYFKPLDYLNSGKETRKKLCEDVFGVMDFRLESLVSYCFLLALFVRNGRRPHVYIGMSLVCACK